MSAIGGKPHVVPVYLTVHADNPAMAMLDALKVIHPVPSVKVTQVRVGEAYPDPDEPRLVGPSEIT